MRTSDILHTYAVILVGPPGFFARPKWEQQFRPFGRSGVATVSISCDNFFINLSKSYMGDHFQELEDHFEELEDHFQDFFVCFVDQFVDRFLDRLFDRFVDQFVDRFVDR